MGGTAKVRFYYSTSQIIGQLQPTLKLSDFSQHCFSAEELVLIFGLGDNSSASPGLGQPDVARLSPALVQQILSGACTDIAEHVEPDGLTTTESKCVWTGVTR